jgi:hypothetical protein
MSSIKEFLSGQFGALEDCRWESMGISETVAAGFDSSRFAPGASGVSIARFLVRVGGSAGSLIFVGLEL